MGRCDTGSNFPMKHSVCVTGVRSQICFTAPQKVCGRGPRGSIVRPYPSVGGLLGNATTCSHVLRCRSGLVDLDPRRVYVTGLNACGQKTGADVGPVRRSLVRLMPNFRAVVPLSSSLVIIPGRKNFTLFDVPTMERHRSHDRSLCVEGVCLSCPGSSLMCATGFLKRGPIPIVTCSVGSIHFSCTLSFFSMKSSVHFRCHLGGKN